ncbi:hypothetical protein AJ87_09080 [Rhizobium yanglingense]|nr:hypothetical protein AJ87_09080 [Rhizobium yanglingense]
MGDDAIGIGDGMLRKPPWGRSPCGNATAAEEHQLPLVVRPFLDRSPEFGLVDRIPSVVVEVSRGPIVHRAGQSPGFDEMEPALMRTHRKNLVADPRNEHAVPGPAIYW